MRECQRAINLQAVLSQPVHGGSNVTKFQAQRMANRLNESMQSYMRAHVHSTKDGLIHFVSVRDKADESIEYLHSQTDKLPDYYFKSGKEMSPR